MAVNVRSGGSEVRWCDGLERVGGVVGGAGTVCGGAQISRVESVKISLDLE